jgi:hypothetical protein
MKTEKIYIYQLPSKKQNKIRKQIVNCLKGIVSSDRLESEVNIVMSGCIDDLRYLEVEL